MEEQKQEIQKQNNWAVPASILIAGILIAIAVIYSSGAKNANLNQQANLNQEQQNPSTGSGQTPEITADDAVLGNPDAKVTIVEFGDYQCPFCAKFAAETATLIKKYYIDEGKVKMVYKGLAFLGEESFNAALATDCAAEQGKFWEYHDKIYEIEYNELKQVMAGKMESNENNGNLNRDLFRKLASDFKMDSEKFLSCYDSQKYKAKIEKNSEEANAALAGRVSTPTFFINNQILQGALPFSNFKSVIDGILNAN